MTVTAEGLGIIWDSLRVKAQKKAAQNVKVRGFTAGGGTKKEAKKKRQQEVKEKTIRGE